MDKIIEITGYGKLEIERVIFESSEPLLFTCISDKKVRFIVVSIHNDCNEKRWLVSKIEVDDILLLLDDKITIRNSFLRGGDTDRYTVFKGLSGFRTLNALEDQEHWNDKSLWLPTVGECLDVDGDEFAEEVAYYQQIQNEESVIEYLDIENVLYDMEITLSIKSVELGNNKNTEFSDISKMEYSNLINSQEIIEANRSGGQEKCLSAAA